MINTNLVRGCVMMFVASLFAFNAYRYPIGDLARAGPGLFPLLVSGLMFVLAAISVAQYRLLPFVPLEFKFKNISLVLLSLVLFVLASRYVSMFLGIPLLIFVSRFAATTYSIKQCTILTVVLTLVALAFETLLGLNLGLL